MKFKICYHLRLWTLLANLMVLEFQLMKTILLYWPHLMPWKFGVWMMLYWKNQVSASELYLFKEEAMHRIEKDWWKWLIYFRILACFLGVVLKSLSYHFCLLLYRFLFHRMLFVLGFYLYSMILIKFLSLFNRLSVYICVPFKVCKIWWYI